MSSQRGFSSLEMPQSPPTGPSSPFRRSSTLCRLTGPQGPSPLPPNPAPLGLQEMGAGRPSAPPPLPDLKLLPGLCSQVASLLAVSGSTAGRPDYLSNAQNLRMGCSPAPHPDIGPGSSAPVPAVTVLPSRRGPRAVPLRPAPQPEGSRFGPEMDIPLLL